MHPTCSSRRLRFSRVGVFALSLAVFALAVPLARASERLEYNRDVRPILAENCFNCHGPDSASRKAGLRLDVREVAVEGEALGPGRPEKSALVTRIFSPSPRKQMPPAKTHKKLT